MPRNVKTKSKKRKSSEALNAAEPAVMEVSVSTVVVGNVSVLPEALEAREEVQEVKKAEDDPQKEFESCQVFRNN